MTGAARGPAVAAAAALVATLPAVGLPLMSDDWGLLAAVEDGVPLVHPFGYVRPVTLAVYALGRLLAETGSWPYRLLALLLAPACAAMVVVLFRKWTGRERIAAAAGVLFALHPLHVEVAAWAASVGDLLATFFVLLSALLFERWRAGRGAAALVASTGAYALALLSKEVALGAPLFLLAGAALDPRRPLSPRRALLGLGPMTLLGLLHLLVVRPHLLGGDGAALPWPGLRLSVARAAFYGVAGIFPLPTEYLEAAPFLFGIAFLVAAVVWIGAAAGRDPGSLRLAVIASAGAAALAAPTVLSFQSRHYFLPSVAASFALAAVVAGAGPRTARVSAWIGAVVWVAAAAVHWDAWYAAGRASRAVVAGIVERARDPEVREIVVANVPHRVRGMPVFGDFGAAAALHTGRALPVRYTTRIDLRSPEEDALDGTLEEAVRREDGKVVVRLRPGVGFQRGLVLPRLPASGIEEDRETGALVATIHAPAGSGTEVLVWSGGRLVPAARVAEPPSGGGG